VIFKIRNKWTGNFLGGYGFNKKGKQWKVLGAAVNAANNVLKNHRCDIEANDLEVVGYELTEVKATSVVDETKALNERVDARNKKKEQDRLERQRTFLVSERKRIEKQLAKLDNKA